MIGSGAAPSVAAHGGAGGGDGGSGQNLRRVIGVINRILGGGITAFPNYFSIDHSPTDFCPAHVIYRTLEKIAVHHDQVGYLPDFKEPFLSRRN